MESLGYTGPYGAGIRTQQSNDGGIDGVITQDRLGLDRILPQAKKWTDKVSQPEVQKFLGALQTQGATKGVFITTSEFTAGAQSAVEKLLTRVVLIGGTELAALMFDHGVGVDIEATYALKRLDQDFFDEV